MDNDVLHGFFSYAALNYGFGIWERANGERVAVTAVFSSREDGETRYGFNDAIYLGEVVRAVRPPQESPRVEMLLQYC